MSIEKKKETPKASLDFGVSFLPFDLIIVSILTNFEVSNNGRRKEKFVHFFVP